MGRKSLRWCLELVRQTNSVGQVAGVGQSKDTRKKVGRTFLSVKNPAKRCVFAASEVSKTNEMALSYLWVLDGQECRSCGGVLTDRNVRLTVGC
ncbi:MAG: hypothetical protein RL215_784 [Planctomycetota bacterium]